MKKFEICGIPYYKLLKSPLLPPIVSRLLWLYEEESKGKLRDALIAMLAFNIACVSFLALGTVLFDLWSAEPSNQIYVWEFVSSFMASAWCRLWATRARDVVSAFCSATTTVIVAFREADQSLSLSSEEKIFSTIREILISKATTIVQFEDLQIARPVIEVQRTAWRALHSAAETLGFNVSVYGPYFVHARERIIREMTENAATKAQPASATPSKEPDSKN